MPAKRADPKSVFLNIPYGVTHEWLLVALTTALVAVGRVPRLTFEIPDGGEGRLARILGLLKSCRVSIHDLSAVGHPPRFNMPFELGLACAIRQMGRAHDYLILERVQHRFDVHCSDLKWIDPKIHGGTVTGAINAVLEALERPGGNPDTAQVLRLYRRLKRMIPLLKQRHHTDDLFRPRIYRDLVALGIEQAQETLG